MPFTKLFSTIPEKHVKQLGGGGGGGGRVSKEIGGSVRPPV